MDETVWGKNQKTISPLRVAGFFVLFSFLLFPALTHASWYSTSWSYRKAITISASKVATTTSAFPVLIDLTDANLASNAQSDGDDILFTQSDGSTKLNHEIEKYSSSNGQLTAWVSSDVSSTTDTTIYMYYGNSSANSQQSATDVWDSNFQGVWHLNNAASTTNAFTDSTSNANHGSGNGGASLASTTAQIDGGYSFDGVNDFVTIGTPASLNLQSITISLWAKPDATLSDWEDWVSHGPNGYLIAVRSTGRIQWGKQDSGDNQVKILGTAILDGSWHQVVGTYDGATLRLYVDGQSVGSLDAAFTFNNSNTLRIGSDVTHGEFSGGIIDDVKISGAPRHSSWILTEYNNQYSTSTFYTVGSQQTEADTISTPTTRASTLYFDTTPPIITLGPTMSQPLPLGTPQTTLSLITNENAVCKYSFTSEMSYFDMVVYFQNSGGLTHSTLVPLPPDQNPVFSYVRCRDDPVGNVTTADTVIKLHFDIPQPFATTSTATTTDMTMLSSSTPTTSPATLEAVVPPELPVPFVPPDIPPIISTPQFKILLIDLLQILEQLSHFLSRMYTAR